MALLLAACSGGGQSALPGGSQSERSGGGAGTAQATQTALVNQPPNYFEVMSFLMTDGSIIVQGDPLSDFYKLTPDAFGSYINGSWSQIASLPVGYTPSAYTSAVLADGRLLLIGGEYDRSSTFQPFGPYGLTNMGAIYDPVADTWTMLPPPDGVPYIGDSASVVLPDGRFALGVKLSQQLVVLDPATLKWSALNNPGKSDVFAEEGFTLLPNGNIFTVDVQNAGHSEHYVPSAQQWVSDGSTPVALTSLDPPPEGNPSTYGPAPIQVVGGVTYGPGPMGIYDAPGEIGPAMLRPDGTVFVTGSANVGAAHTAIYHPGATAMDAGSWTTGPDFPDQDEAGDSSVAMLPSGHVLVIGSMTGNIYEFDGSNFLVAPTGPGGGGTMLPLPTGEVLVLGLPLYTYASPLPPDPTWAPTISSVPTTLTHGSTYTVSGTQFNGLSNAVSFGDEYSTNTNFPLVRITNSASGHVFYARTHDHSTMAVATGSARVSTQFDVPAGTEAGASTLVVVANGIASKPANVSIQ